MEKFETIIGERIDLIPISLEGLQDMHEYSTMPEFFRFFEYKPFKNIKQTENYLKKLIDKSKTPSSNFWFIKIHDGQIIGTFGVINIDERRKSAELGFGISPKFWNQGFFSESLGLILKNLFDKSKLHRITVLTHSENTSSISGLEKAGFKKDGVLREFYLSHDGNRYDAILFSILKNEFSDK